MDYTARLQRLSIGTNYACRVVSVRYLQSPRRLRRIAADAVVVCALRAVACCKGQARGHPLPFSLPGKSITRLAPLDRQFIRDVFGTCPPSESFSHSQPLIALSVSGLQGPQQGAILRFGVIAACCSNSKIFPPIVRPFGVKTLRTQDTSDPRHFGTSAEVSFGHFGTSAELSGRSVRKTLRHYGRHFGTALQGGR